MGGRGASSGMSHWVDRRGKVHKNKYGTQYRTLYEYENIKFIERKSRDSEQLLETMTDGRIYVTVGGGKDLINIILFDENNRKTRTIDLKPPAHDGMLPHTHYGYIHDENGTRKPTGKEELLIDKVRKIWNNGHSK